MITLIDLSAEFWRNWHAVRSDVDAYQLTMEKVEWYANDCPQTAICCEGARPARIEWFPEYKANRPPKPKEATDSLRAIREQLESWGLPVLSCEGYEADDVIATLCSQAWLDDVQILSADKDLYQLLTDNVRIITKNGPVGPEECVRKWGVRPGQIRDLLALTGDAADNIPGCPNTGPGRARDLLQRFDSLDGILAATDEEILDVRGVGKKTLDSLRSWDPSLALKLVTLLYDAPVNLDELWKGNAA